MKIFQIFVTCLSLGVIGTGITLYLYADKKSGTAYIEGETRVITPELTEEWEIVSIHDGDTIKVRKSGITENIRFCGIDAPEISQSLGRESRDYLRLLISPDNLVQISIVGTDKYNRKIGEVFKLNKDGTEKFINEELVLSGLAYHYAQYSKSCPNVISLKNGEAIAQSKKIGIWNGEHEKPWDYRKSKRNKTISKGNL
jgi:micrococcal nuclease